MQKTSPTVLLVEDNEDNRIVFSTVLQHFGYEVSQAVTGDEGLALAQSNPPDVILMDISVPGIDGFELTRRLRGFQSTASIPIIALTAHALASDKRKAMEAGCDDFLTKPCEPKRVVETVRRWLASGRKATNGNQVPLIP